MTASKGYATQPMIVPRLVSPHHVFSPYQFLEVGAVAKGVESGFDPDSVSISISRGNRAAHPFERLRGFIFPLGCRDPN
jgi:hypothetical protein